jgi:hypothetical protein
MRKRMTQHEAQALASDQGVADISRPSDFSRQSDLSRQADVSRQSHFRHGGAGPGVWGTGSERGGSQREMGGVGFLLRQAELFKLSEEQQESLGKLRVQFELEKVDKLATLQKAKIVLRVLMRDHQSREPDVLSAIDKLAACEADLRRMRYYHRKVAWDHLNADQRSEAGKRALRLRSGP